MGSGGIWWDLVGSGGIWWWNQTIPPDPGSWWNLWWNHLIPREPPDFHVWQSIGGSLWNQRKSIVEWGLRRFWPCSCVQRAMSAEQDPRRGRAGLVHGIEQGPGGGGRRGRSFLSYFLVCLPVSCRFALVHLLSPITMSHFH